ncbi:MAG: DUF4389 domain-containing protein [Acidimicrobiales bacterium]
MTDPSAAPPPPPGGGFPPSPPGGGATPPPPAAGPAPTGGYPVHLDFGAPLEVANWRPLVHWLLVIPYAIVVAILGWALSIVAFVAFFTVVFTKRIPDGMFRFMSMCLRVSWRSSSYHYFMREPYPEWDFTSASADPGGDPATVSIDEPGELNRWLPFVKWLLAIPHYVVLFFLFIGLSFVVLIGFFAVLFTGRWPEGLREYVVGVHRWGLRVVAYIFYMTDDYPPFSLD